ncbi:hypothetical protein THH46_06140 [Pseudomonas sp. NA13]
MQQDITVRMREQPEAVCDPHAAQSNEVAFSETVNIVAVANTHKNAPIFVRA